jgi:hypothetical protein
MVTGRPICWKFRGYESSPTVAEWAVSGFRPRPPKCRVERRGNVPKGLFRFDQLEAAQPLKPNLDIHARRQLPHQHQRVHRLRRRLQDVGQAPKSK